VMGPWAHLAGRAGSDHQPAPPARDVSGAALMAGYPVSQEGAHTRSGAPLRCHPSEWILLQSATAGRCVIASAACAEGCSDLAVIETIVVLINALAHRRMTRASIHDYNWAR
jgi:hypothetical protein